MHFFVTGGTGFLGSHFLAASLAAGHRVTALRRNGGKTRIALKQEPRWCNGDLGDDLSDQLRNCDALIHLAAAGVTTYKDDWDYCFRINVTQSLALWRQAVDCGIKYFLICGSCFEYGMSGLSCEYIHAEASLLPIDAYSASKASATMAAIGLANRFNLRLLIARPFHLYGEGEAETRFWPSLRRAALAGEDFAMSEGQQIRDFMRVDDAAETLLMLACDLKKMTTCSAVRNIGTGRPTTLLKFAQEQWALHNGTVLLLPGKIPYRSNEIMRYVPSLVSICSTGSSPELLQGSI